MRILYHPDTKDKIAEIQVKLKEQENKPKESS